MAILQLTIVAGPPELDFYFSIARGETIEITLESRSGAQQRMKVYVDGLKVLLGGDKSRDSWQIWGRFYGDGKTSWSNFLYRDDKEKRVRHEYALWGDFLAGYNKRTRKGYLEISHHKNQKINY